MAEVAKPKEVLRVESAGGLDWDREMAKMVAGSSKFVLKVYLRMQRGWL